MPIPILLLALFGAGVAAAAAAAKPARLTVPPGGWRPGPGQGARMQLAAIKMRSVVRVPTALLALIVVTQLNTHPFFFTKSELVNKEIKGWMDGDIADDVAHRHLLNILWLLVAFGLDSVAAHKQAATLAAPDSPTALNRKQLVVARGAVEVAIAHMADPVLSPWGVDPRERGRELIKWVEQMIQLPNCAAEGATDTNEHTEGPIDGHSIDTIYVDHNESARCADRQALYIRIRHSTIISWLADRGLPHIEGRTMLQYPDAGSDEDAEALVSALEDLTRRIAYDKMVVWPGGPASQPTVDWGKLAEFLVRAFPALARAMTGDTDDLEDLVADIEVEVVEQREASNKSRLELAAWKAKQQKPRRELVP
jgi:hypothetical protein